MRYFFLLVSMIVFVACSGSGGGSGQGGDSVFPSNGKNGVPFINLWVEENINSCLFPNDTQFMCDRDALDAMRGFRVHTDYHFEIKLGPQIFIYNNGVQHPSDKLDQAGFNKPYKTGIYGKPGGMAREQYALNKTKTKLQIRYFYQEEGQVQYKLMKTRTLIPFKQKDFKEIDRAVNYLSLPGTYYEKRKALLEKMEKRQARVMSRIVPQNGIDLVTDFGGFQYKKFKVQFTQEVVDALEAQDQSSFVSIAFLNGKLYPNDYLDFVVPRCGMFKEDRFATLVAGKEYEATTDHPNKPSGFIEIDFGSEYQGTKGFAFFCERDYDDGILLTSDIEHALGDLGEVSFF